LHPEVVSAQRGVGVLGAQRAPLGRLPFPANPRPADPRSDLTRRSKKLLTDFVDADQEPAETGRVLHATPATGDVAGPGSHGDPLGVP
jgi:hypothetical protein